MQPFVERLAELCRAHVTRNKWVFAPTHAIGRTVGEQLALGGTNWLNLRFVTPLDIALRMGAPFLVERGIDPSEDGLGPALVMRLLLDLPEEGGYFRPLADQPTMAQALWGTIRELRMAGIKSSDLGPASFDSAAKHAELKALLGSYEQFLSTNKRGDMAAVYEEALLHRDWCPIQEPDCWTELPDVVWTPLQRRLMDAMPGERMVPVALSIPGATVPRRLAEAPVERIAPDRAISPLAFLLAASPESRVPSPESAVSLFHAGGREAEIDEVFRRLIRSAAPVDQVEIACASPEYASLIWEKACRHGFPVTVATGIPAALTRPGRAVLAWCDWIAGRFAAVDLRHMLQSGDVALDLPNGLSAGKAARLLARAEATWGRDTYKLALTRLARVYQRTSADEERSVESRDSARENAEACQALQGWIQALLDAVPEPETDGTLALARIVAAAEEFVETCCARTSALDGVARLALGEEIAELRSLDGFRCSLGQALGFVRERAVGLTIAPDRARPGHLHISTLPQAAYAGRPHLFVVGIEEGRVFPAAVEDPVLLDVERARISPLLRLSSDRTDEAVHAVLSRLAVAAESRAPSARLRQGSGGQAEPRVPPHITFSFSCLDTRQYRESLPSWLFLQAARLLNGEPGLTYEGLRKRLGEPVSCVPASQDRAVSEAGWWLAALKEAPESGRPQVLAHFEQVASGEAAARARAADGFSEYDGYAPAAGSALDPVANAIAVSSSTLQDAAICPHRHFIRRALRVEPVPDADRDRDAWLDPLTKGSELHELFAQLMRRCRNEHRRPEPEQDGWLLVLARDRLDALAREMPPPSPEVAERERGDLLRDVELFIRHEAARQDGEPIGFEVSFGRRFDGADDQEDALARVEPVAVPLRKGRRVLLNGRIDRIDRVSPSVYDVIDYKTGGFSRDKWEGTFAGGTRLQHALYEVAAAELLQPIDAHATVRQGVYLFTSARGALERVVIPNPGPAETAAVLEDLLSVISSGVFVHTSDKDDCRYCDFGRACGVGAPERAKRKLQNMAEARLDCVRKLAGHD